MIRAALAALALVGLAGAAQAQPRVAAPAGTFEGAADGAILSFKGIPYAEAPIGPLRWAPPRPAERPAGVRRATDFGPACVQSIARTGSLYASDLPRMGEDCLSLNVWAPRDARGAPVFVWIHGGSLTAGSSSEPMYDGSKLAAQGLVVVSINYRLGVLGYLAHPELSAESPLGVSGNYGLLDQIEALRWVQRNIAAFGGDPAGVMVAGESAGGLSVMYLMAAPAARGLFSQAIAQSAYMISAPELKQARFGARSAEDDGAALAAKLNAAGVAGLRAMDAASLVQAARAAGFAASGTVDGQVLPRQLVEVFDRGEQAPVPILAGFNSGEIRSLRVLAPPVPQDPATYEPKIRELYGDLAGEFLRLYPAFDVGESILAATRDALYGWTAERLAVSQTARGAPAYLYLFDHGYPAAEALGLHAFHASELPYVFGTAASLPPNWPRPPDGGADGRLSEAMMAYWASFARTGTPSASGEAAWPAYGAARTYMAFKDAPRAATRLLPGMYELHEAVVCRRRAAGTQGWNWNVGLWSPPLPPEASSCG